MSVSPEHQAESKTDENRPSGEPAENSRQASAMRQQTLEHAPSNELLADRDTDKLQKSRELACRCAQLADELKAADIRVLDLTQVTAEFDYFVLATGASRRQLHAIVEDIDRMLAAAGVERLGVEGYDSNAWILQDYGDIVLHVFDRENRELYDLERLWGDATVVDWQAVCAELDA